MIAPDHTDETRRLAALAAFDILDTPADPAFDDLAKLAAFICDVPIALVSLVDGTRQWFKSRVGIDACETPRGLAFCAHAIQSDALMEVPDATADARFADNPLVTGEPHIRFYAGAPLVAPGGHRLGTLCVIDRRPRTLSPEQTDALRVLSRQVMALIVARRQVAELERTRAEWAESEGRFRAFMEHSPAMAFIKDADGRFVFVNGPCARRFEIPVADWIGKTDHDLWAPSVADTLRAQDLAVLAGTDGVTLTETVPTKDGRSECWRSSKFPLVAPDGRRFLAGIAVDVTPEKRAADALAEREQRFRAIFDSTFQYIGLLAADGTVLEANRTALSAAGVTAAEVLGRPFWDAVWWAHDPALQAKLRDGIRRAAAGEFVRFEAVHPLAAGGAAHIDFSISPIRDESGAVVLLVPEGRDVTAWRQADAAARETAESFRTVLEGLAEGVLLVDHETRRVLHANDAFRAIVGYSADELTRLSHYDLAAHTREDIDARVSQVVERGHYAFGDRKYRAADGSLVDVQVSCTLVRQDARPVLAFLVSDVSARKRYEAQLIHYQRELEGENASLQKRATIDALTDVFNRAAFTERLATEYARADRLGRPLSLLMIDVDHFKQFNDTFGHPAGDDVLRTVAMLLRAAVRGADVVARYGGEEFAVILPDTDYAGAMVLADRVCRTVAEASWDRRPMTVSVGAATRSDGTPHPADLIAEADDALYRSKRAGRNRYTHRSGSLSAVLTRR